MRTFLYQHEIHLVKKTYRTFQINHLGERIVAKLFKTYPFLENEVFPDMTDLGASVMSVVELVIHSFEENKHGQFVLRRDTLVPLRNSVKAYEKYGVKREYYIMAGKLMVETIQEENLHLNSAAIQYWRLLVNLTVSSMIEPTLESKFSSGRFIKERFRLVYQKILNGFSTKVNRSSSKSRI